MSSRSLQIDQKVQIFARLVLSRLESFFSSVFFVGKAKVQMKIFCVALVAWRVKYWTSRKVYWRSMYAFGFALPNCDFAVWLIWPDSLGSCNASVTQYTHSGQLVNLAFM